MYPARYDNAIASRRIMILIAEGIWCQFDARNHIIPIEISIAPSVAKIVVTENVPFLSIACIG